MNLSRTLIQLKEYDIDFLVVRAHSLCLRWKIRARMAARLQDSDIRSMTPSNIYSLFLFFHYHWEIIFSHGTWILILTSICCKLCIISPRSNELQTWNSPTCTKIKFLRIFEFLLDITKSVEHWKLKFSKNSYNITGTYIISRTERLTEKNHINEIGKLYSNSLNVYP